MITFATPESSGLTPKEFFEKWGLPEDNPLSIKWFLKKFHGY